MNDYLNRVGRPVPAANGGGAEVPVQHAAAAPNKKKKLYRFFSFKTVFMVLLGCITILLIALIVYILVYKNNTATLSPVNKPGFQAVFLNSSDGQVYFGHLTQLNKNWFELTDIYYIRVNSSSSSSSSSNANQSISLAKLGSEIHGPQDAMYVNVNNVMFWENLKESGQVVTAIRKYEAQQKTGTTTNSTSNTTSNTSVNP